MRPGERAVAGVVGDWADQARCKGRGDTFFPVSSARTGAARMAADPLYDAAKTICRTCPVIAPCLEFALETGEFKHGVYGGMTPGERRAAAHERKVAARG